MASLEPLLTTSPAIQLHVATVTIAAIAGLVIFVQPKGTTPHRWLGRVYVIAMVLGSISSFFIHEIRTIGQFSPIHLISIGVLVTLVLAIRAIRQGRVAAHRREMVYTYVGGILIAGAFTFLPGRMMAEMTYGGAGGQFPVSWLFASIAVAWGASMVLRRKPLRR